MELTRILAAAQPHLPFRPPSIAEGETRTHHGLALSPTMAAMCAGDFARTITFLRGTHAAIRDLRKIHPARPVRVLYAGCGPQATLAVPLMAVHSPAEATFTLIDLHPESIASAWSVVARLELASSVSSLEVADATNYRICPEQPPDLILVEVMQACLAAEPQVAITRHLLTEAPNAILIPEEVRIDLLLVNPSREFDLDGQVAQPSRPQRDRIAVASIFVVNRETIRSWATNRSDRLPAATVRIPDFPRPGYQPMLFTTIRVYQTNVLQDYDSGLTCPRALPVAGQIKPGDTIQFCYELGGHPRLTGDVGGGVRSW